MKPSQAAMLAFKRRLLSWYRKQARDLPWRRTRDPYRVLVSEFMLQQTQVSRVREYYGKFLARYPTIHARRECAKYGKASAITGERRTFTDWHRQS